MGNFGILLPPKLFLRISMLLFLVVHNASAQYSEGSRRLKPCELESLLRDLTYPEEGYEMHAAALRNQLRHILERDPTEGGYQSLDEYGSYDNSGPYEDKRSYRSLLREGPPFYKRNLGSLARAGLLRGPPSSDYLKRSIATLAKNGQLPASREPDSSEASTAGGWTDEKRNLASARAFGYMLNGKRNIASLARKYELPGKRNIQSLLRTGMLPSIAPKRNMQSLARDNAIPHYAAGPQESKRNIQTLVRDWNLPRQQSVASENEKRNIQALKNSQGHGGDSGSGGRKKRELYYDDEALDDGTPEILEPVYQSAPLDYEELMEAMNEAYPAQYYNNPADNHLEEKRYLGSRSSFTPNPSDYDNLSPAFVDDATALATAADFEQQQQHLLPSTLAAGEPPVYSPLPRGVPRRPESPRYTGGAFASRPRLFGGGLPEEYPFYDGGSSEAPPQNPFYSEDEFRCAARLRKLLYYLKKQYYLDNKYIQAVYGRNNVRY